MKYVFGALIGFGIAISGTAFAATVSPTFFPTSMGSIPNAVISTKGENVYKFLDGKVTCYAYTKGGISCIK